MSEIQYPERARNPRGQGARLRTDIIRAAGALLEGDSAESVTLRAVARQAGISAPSIYAHFRHRDEIMQALVTEAFDELEHALHVEAELDPTVELRELCNAYLRFAEERPQRYRLMFGGVWDAAKAQLNAHHTAELGQLGHGPMRILAGSIQRCSDAGVLETNSPSDDATALWVCLHGLSELRRTAPLFPWPPDIEEQLIARVTRLR